MRPTVEQALRSASLTMHIAPNLAACRAAQQRRAASSARSAAASSTSTAAQAAPTAGTRAAPSDSGGAAVFLSRSQQLSLLGRIADARNGSDPFADLSTCRPCCSSSCAGGNGVGAPVVDGCSTAAADLLDAVYDEAENIFHSRRGFVISRREAAQVDATGGSAAYGEFTREGVRALLEAVPLQADDVLVDLGSGLGRVVLQVAASARLARCEGVELVASRHEQAVWAAQRLAAAQPAAAATPAPVAGGTAEDAAAAGAAPSCQPHAPRPHGAQLAAAPDAAASLHSGGALLSPVALRHADVLTADLGDGSAFLLCSTAFSTASARRIAERLAAHPPFRLLVASRALPLASPLVLVGHFPCPYTWSAGGTAYVYVRSLREAPSPLLAAFLSAPAAGEEGERHAAGGGVAWLPNTTAGLCVVQGDLML